MEHEHSPQAIRQRLAAGPRSSYLRDGVYGGIDGAVTTFAVASGVVGAGLSSRIILILGFANLVADGFSMAAGNYSGTRAEREEFEQVEQIERRHIRLEPEGEREEVRQLYRRKGFEGPELERIVEVISSNPERWVRTMLSEEYGLPLVIRSPLLAAASTLGAFALCGLMPLLPYLLDAPSPFRLSMIATGLAFFTIGSVKSRWTVIPWWRSGLETLLIGSAAASLAYAIGYALRGLAAA